LVVDDYGHHPTEIAAVIAAARAGLDRRVVLVFQPHRYSRTEQLLDEFGAALAQADVVLVTDVYAAGEDPRPGVSADAVVAAVARHGAVPVQAVGPVDGVPSAVAAVARPGDLVVTLGAGSIGTMGERILAALGGAPAAEDRS
jgi:UDP-N-acetylmuramate--alanine ligase